MTGCRPTVGTPTPPSAEFRGAPPASPVVAVAYSGGRDSTALLHATLAAANETGARVLALHVHHGLSPNADAWLAHCQAECRRWAAEGRAVGFAFRRLSGRPAAGQSVEAWARTERYAALRAMALDHGATLVLLAHHRQDQAETWWLQALRAGGVAGLAAMPGVAERGGLRWVRPWLHRPRSELEAYVRRHGLAHVEDETNTDPRFARNRLRLQAWPALVAAFPEAEAAFAQAANWSQQAAAALAELAQIDLATVTHEGGLVLERWRALSVARRSNALRAWLSAGCRAPVSAALIGRLLDELPHARTGRWRVGTGELRLHRGLLRYFAAAHPVDAAAVVAPPRERRLCIDRVDRYPLTGWSGSLSVRPVAEGGVPLAELGPVELRPRGGGEQFQAGAGRPPRSLKKQFQDAGVAPWDRDGPLVFSGGRLVYVPGLGLDARVLGLAGQPRVDLHWQAGDPAKPCPGGG